ncbi:hypothetical protein [Polyangium aurulentum]|uniref:hypothetical protein n=1 Tax=Polyangium aurulentum TaxID=2567896 RepID=UPI00146A78F1|nr:hypothetical protein [Polyangium aurulentum]UQA57999.1 hypothetical protein E8A73_043140 [Polyangium aurulentum]
MMKTPFVAHPPSILVVHADADMAAACKTAGASMGIPVRRAPTVEAASSIVRDTRPYVIAYDASFAAEIVAVVDKLAAEVDAGVVPLHGGEPQEALTARLREACEGAEKRRK